MKYYQTYITIITLRIVYRTLTHVFIVYIFFHQHLLFSPFLICISNTSHYIRWVYSWELFEILILIRSYLYILGFNVFKIYIVDVIYIIDEHKFQNVRWKSRTTKYIMLLFMPFVRKKRDVQLNNLIIRIYYCATSLALHSMWIIEQRFINSYTFVCTHTYLLNIYLSSFNCHWAQVLAVIMWCVMWTFVTQNKNDYAIQWISRKRLNSADVECLHPS